MGTTTRRRGLSILLSSIVIKRYKQQKIIYISIAAANFPIYFATYFAIPVIVRHVFCNLLAGIQVLGSSAINFIVADMA